MFRRMRIWILQLAWLRTQRNKICLKRECGRQSLFFLKLYQEMHGSLFRKKKYEEWVKAVEVKNRQKEEELEGMESGGISSGAG